MESLFSSIHILSFAAWLGANLFCFAVLLPATATLPSEARWQARGRASRDLTLLASISAPLVLFSGSAWLIGTASALGHSFIIAGKVALTLAMIGAHLLQAMRYAPKLAGDLAPASSEPVQSQTAWGIWVRLLAVNVALGVGVFLLGLFLI